MMASVLKPWRLLFFVFGPLIADGDTSRICALDLANAQLLAFPKLWPFGLNAQAGCANAKPLQFVCLLSAQGLKLSLALEKPSPFERREAFSAAPPTDC